MVSGCTRTTASRAELPVASALAMSTFGEWTGPQERLTSGARLPLVVRHVNVAYRSVVEVATLKLGAKSVLDNLYLSRPRYVQLASATLRQASLDFIDRHSHGAKVAAAQAFGVANYVAGLLAIMAAVGL